MPGAVAHRAQLRARRPALGKRGKDFAWSALVARQSAAHAHMPVRGEPPGKPRGDLRRQGGLGDHLGVRVDGQGRDNVGRQIPGRRETSPDSRVGVGGDPPRPPLRDRAKVSHGDHDVRIRAVELVHPQQSTLHKANHHLRVTAPSQQLDPVVAEVVPAGRLKQDRTVVQGEEHIDKRRWQARVAGQPQA